LAQLRLLAHPLQQLHPLAQELGGAFVAAALLQFLGTAEAGVGGHQAEIGLAAAAESRCLGRLKGAVGQLKALQGHAGLQQQQQAGHLLAAGQLQRRLQRFLAGAEGGELCLIGRAALAVAEQLGAGPQQVFAGLKRFQGVALVWGTVDPQLQGAQQGMQVCRRAQSEQPEVVDRQFQPAISAGEGLYADRAGISASCRGLALQRRLVPDPVQFDPFQSASAGELTAAPAQPPPGQRRSRADLRADLPT
jgi:hypothetical protein